MRHTRQEQLRIREAFRRFETANPPKMPEDFSHKDYKRVVGYARAAFICGYHTGENDFSRPERVEDNKKPRRAPTDTTGPAK